MTRVAIVVFDGIIPFHMSVPYAVFEKVRNEQGVNECQLSVCTLAPGAIQTNAGFSIIVENDLDTLLDKDIVIVPSWDDPSHQPDSCLIEALYQAHENGAILMGLCMGAFVLAATGLLNGKTATTHWQWAEAFRQQFPTVLINEKVLYIDHGNVVTSAGTAASIDCCLHLVRRRWGAETANSVARQLVVSPHRQGGQAQYIDIPVHHCQKKDSLSAVIQWASEHLHSPLTLTMAADKACMSPRNFTRRFQKITGYTFSRWLIHQRLILVQRYLESTDYPIERVAEMAGFPSPISLRRHFREHFQLSPSEYRQTFTVNV